MFCVVSTLFLIPVAIPHARALSDIDDYVYKSAILYLQSRGIISGYPDGTFLPHQPINRAEFLKILMLSVYGTGVFQAPSGRCFEDFDQEYRWYWPYACAAKQLGIIEGYPDGTFRGTDTIILAEALKMSLIAWKVPLPEENPSRPWYERYMSSAAEREVFRRFPYTPAYLLTRGEVAQLLMMLGEEIAVLDPSAIPTATRIVTVPFPTTSVCGNGRTEYGEQCDDGNLLNDDGCSKICVIVAEPIRHGALRVEQLAISNASQTSGNRDVPLFALTAIAGRQDVYLTTLKLKSTFGSLSFGENYRLFLDQDGDGVVETLYGRAASGGETLVFSNMNILVKDGAYVRLEVWADINTTLSPGSVALGFATSHPDFVEGVDRIDGEEVSGIVLDDGDCTLQTICWVNVITAGDQTVPIQTNGNLYVTGDTVPMGSRQVLASRLSPALLALSLRADAEDIRIKKFAIDGVQSSVDHLQLFTDGASQPFAIARKSGCAPLVANRYCADTEFIVPRNAAKKITVKAKINSDMEGAVSAQVITLMISALTSGNVAFAAEGYYSGRQLLHNNGDASADGEIVVGTDSPGGNAAIIGPSHTVTFAKPEDIFSSSADVDGSQILGGSMTFARFGFRAAHHDNTKNGQKAVAIDSLAFTVSAVNVVFDAGSFQLYNVENASVVKNCSASGVTGVITVTCSGLRAAAISTIISPGGTIHLALRGSISNPQVAPGGVSVLQASLSTLGNPATPGTVLWFDGENTFDWVDIGKTQVKGTTYRS